MIQSTRPCDRGKSARTQPSDQRAITKAGIISEDRAMDKQYILALINRHMDNREIAEELGISVRSFKQLCRKMGIDRKALFSAPHRQLYTDREMYNIESDNQYYDIYDQSIDDILFK